MRTTTQPSGANRNCQEVRFVRCFSFGKKAALRRPSVGRCARGLQIWVSKKTIRLFAELHTGRNARRHPGEANFPYRPARKSGIVLPRVRPRLSRLRCIPRKTAQRRVCVRPLGGAIEPCNSEEQNSTSPSLLCKLSKVRATSP